MAVKLISNYAKRLGLPGYSSHQFSVSVETELTDLGQVQGEAVRLYGLLQTAVDREIQQTGFVPGHDYGEATPPGHSQHPHGNGNGNGQPRYRIESNADQNGANWHQTRWSCSDKQKELILRLVNENYLDRDKVEQTAQDRFGVGVKQLNKLQASGLISELLEVCGGSNGRSGKGGGR
jgi:hypothetical protein